MQKEIKDFFLGLSKLTLKMSLNKYFSLQSFNDHFEMGWVESGSILRIKRFTSLVSTTILKWVGLKALMTKYSISATEKFQLRKC